MKIRSVLVALVALLPASELKNVLLRRMGWAIGDGAHIGPCLIVNVDRAQIGNRACIGSLSVVRDLTTLTVGEHAVIGHWNWVSASKRLAEAGAPCELYLGTHSALTSRHYVDCSGGVRIGTHTTIAGVRSTFVTHGISWKSSAQTFNPIEIGDYCLISSNVQVAPGTVVGSKVVVGMGATIAGKLLEPGLYVQSRAIHVKPDLAGEYFTRKEGHVDIVEARG